MREPIMTGWSHADITPYGRKVYLQGQVEERFTDQVHDPIYATVLALESPSDCAILVSMDLSLPSQEITDALRDEVCRRIVGFDRQKLIVFAVHVHTAPVQDDFYRAFFVEKVAAAVQQAWENRKPSVVSPVVGYCCLGHNRRVLYKDETGGMYATTNTSRFESMEGGEDSSVELVYFFDQEGKPRGCIANCACPSQAVGGEKYISGDLYAHARRTLWDELGTDFELLPMVSAAGDLVPQDLLRHHPKHQYEDPYETVIELSGRLTREILYRLGQAAKALQSDVVLRHRYRLLDLPARRVTQNQLNAAHASMRELLAIEQVSKPEQLSFYLNHLYNGHLDTVKYYEKQDENLFFTMEMNIIRIGDCAIVSCPFELFLDYGQAIKTRSKASYTLIAQLCGKYGGYLATKRALRNYTPISVDQCTDEGGEMLVSHAVEQINRLFDE